jgi:phytoene desaturase
MKALIIGAGFSGLSTAAYLAKQGYEVTVLEKHDGPGGRGRQWKKAGYTFDMGPSWYWMPDVFEKFFADFGKKPSDYYQLDRLDPSYSVFFEDGPMEIPANMQELEALFERVEPGSAVRLRKFLSDAAYKYEVGINDLVRKPSRSVFEFADLRVLKGLFQLDLLNNIRSSIKKVVKNPQLQQLLEFPVLFLGATPSNTPALYSLMNYSDMVLGTWYPQGGMYAVVEAFYKVALEQGATFVFDTEVTGFTYQNGQIASVVAGEEEFKADLVVASADYAHVDQKLLAPQYRKYSKSYWDRRKMAPSSFLYYVGLDAKIPGIEHHSLFFDAPFDVHADAIYTEPRWPEKPLFYLSAASKTDPQAAPEGGEALVILIPTAPGLPDTDEVLETYFHLVADRMKDHLGMDIREHVVFKRTYAYRDFVKDYHAHKGNAYGLANTLDQTAIFKPSLKSKVPNLYYTGQLTVPGPGVPPCIISGEVVSAEIEKEYPLVP